MQRTRSLAARGAMPISLALGRSAGAQGADTDEPLSTRDCAPTRLGPVAYDLADVDQSDNVEPVCRCGMCGDPLPIASMERLCDGCANWPVQLELLGEAA
jgi:hypothetical protein